MSDTKYRGTLTCLHCNRQFEPRPSDSLRQYCDDCRPYNRLRCQPVSAVYDEDGNPPEPQENDHEPE